MKKKYILIMLLLVFLVKNPKAYADEYCDKLSEYKQQICILVMDIQ